MPNFIDHAHIAAVAEFIRSQSDDEELLLDMLEGETDLFEIVRKLLEANEDDEGRKEALTEQMAVRKERRDKCENRIALRRTAIRDLMAAAGIEKLPLPEATISKQKVKAKVIVIMSEAVPQELCKATWKPDLEKIKAQYAADSENLPNWIGIEPERETIVIRRK